MSNDATRMYSTCFSDELDGYCERSSGAAFVLSDPILRGFCDEEIETTLEAVEDTRCGILGGAPGGPPVREEWRDGAFVDGKDERDGCRLMPLVLLALVPLVEGRWGKADAILAEEGNTQSINDARKERSR